MNNLEKLQKYEQKLVDLKYALFEVYVLAPEGGEMINKCGELFNLVRKTIEEAERAEDQMLAAAENGVYGLLA